MVADRLAQDPHFYDDPNGMSKADQYLSMLTYHAAAANDFRVTRPGSSSGSNSRLTESNVRYLS